MRSCGGDLGVRSSGDRARGKNSRGQSIQTLFLAVAVHIATLGSLCSLWRGGPSCLQTSSFWGEESAGLPEVSRRKEKEGAIKHTEVAQPVGEFNGASACWQFAGRHLVPD
jgi:hypothetical protein